MSPLPPLGNVIVTDGGLITPYQRVNRSENHDDIIATLAAHNAIESFDIYGIENLNEASFDYPPTSNIKEVSVLENGALHVVGETPWLQKFPELNLEIGYEGDFYIDCYISFE